MQRPRTAAVLLTAPLCLALIGLTGCGGGGPSLSKSDYLTKANDACTQLQAREVKLAKIGGTDPTADDKALSALAGLFNDYISQQSSLADQTKDKSVLHSKWLDPEKTDFDKFDAILKQVVTAERTKDTAKIAALSGQLQNVAKDSGSIASFQKSYGLDKCAAAASGGR